MRFHICANAARADRTSPPPRTWWVRRAPWRGRHAGLMSAGDRTFLCSLGRSGISVSKREGDGATPASAMRVLAALGRTDRLPVAQRARGLSAILRDLGWCDAPADPNYNRPVRLPFGGGRESMWRKDALYDICLPLDWNFRPRVMGRGSAIFLHLRRPDGGPTQGCVALSLRDMRTLLSRGWRNAVLRVIA